jgi:hypothetical protein
MRSVSPEPAGSLWWTVRPALTLRASAFRSASSTTVFRFAWRRPARLSVRAQRNSVERLDLATPQPRQPLPAALLTRETPSSLPDASSDPAFARARDPNRRCRHPAVVESCGVMAGLSNASCLSSRPFRRPLFAIGATCRALRSIGHREVTKLLVRRMGARCIVLRKRRFNPCSAGVSCSRRRIALVGRRRRLSERSRPSSCSARTCRSVTGRASEKHAGTSGENHCGIRRALTAGRVLP